MIKTIYKGYFIVEEFNALYDIRNTLGLLEAENFRTIKACKTTIDKWVQYKQQTPQNSDVKRGKNQIY